jgi:hypothetical protein
MGRGVYNQQGGRRYQCFWIYIHTNLCTRHTHTHTHTHTWACTNEGQLCTHCAWLKKKLQKAHQCGPYLSVGPRLSLSLSFILIYYITESDNRKKQTQKDKKKEAKANIHDFDHVSMLYSSSPLPLPPVLFMSDLRSIIHT